MNNKTQINNKKISSRIDRIFSLNLTAQNSSMKTDSNLQILSSFLPKDKIMDFCKVFNKESLIFKKDFKVRIIFILYKNKQYDFFFKGPYFIFFVKHLLGINLIKKNNNKKNNLYIYLDELFFISYYFYNFYYFKHDIKSIFSILLNNLKIFNIKILKK